MTKKKESQKFNFNKNDELYTPPCLVEIIIPYLKEKKFKTIWCPFDTENSEYVTILKKNKFKVINTHIENDEDFFEIEPKSYDCIVSNPPFSVKLKVLDRLYGLHKPFAMLLGLPILNYQEIGKFFYEEGSDLQLLIPDKKVSFDGNTSAFNFSYFCRGVLTYQLTFCHLENNNSGKNFVGSKMRLKTKGFTTKDIY